MKKKKNKLFIQNCLKWNSFQFALASVHYNKNLSKTIAVEEKPVRRMIESRGQHFPLYWSGEQNKALYLPNINPKSKSGWIYTFE